MGEPERVELRSSAEGPGCTGSGADVVGPRRDRPKGADGEPERAGLRVGVDGPVWAGSGIGMGGSSLTRLRAGG